MTNTEIRIEIANVRDAIIAHKNGVKHLSPAGYSEAPGVAWLQMQMRVLQGQVK